MFERLLALLEKLKASEGNKEEIASIETQMAMLKEQGGKIETLKTEHADYKKVVELVGDRDVGKMIAYVDTMKEIGLDTPEKIVDLQSKASETEKSLTEQKDLAIALQGTLDSKEDGFKDQQKEIDKKSLLVDAKLSLQEHAGHAKLFDLSLNEIMATDKVTRDPDNSDKILYDGKPIGEAVENWRAEFGGAFKEAPSGAGGGGGGNGDHPNQGNDKGGYAAVVSDMK
jgi:hypothetical protein